MRGRAFVTGLALSAATVVASLPTFATVYRVSQTATGTVHNGLTWQTAYLRIQDAVAAHPTETVTVAAGTYHEIVVGNSLTHLLGGYSGSDSTPDLHDPVLYPTTVDGNKVGSVVSGSAEVDGFTITNGLTAGDGGGLSGVGTIAHCTITGNKAARGGGVFNSDGSSVYVHDCTITNNTATVSGGGIWCGGHNASHIENNDIANNQAPNAAGIDLYGPSTAIVTLNQIQSNIAGFDTGGWGGGLRCTGTRASITYNVFNNSAVYGGSIAFTGQDGSVLYGNTISGLGYSGGGIIAYYSAPEIADNIFYACKAGGGTGTGTGGIPLQDGQAIECFGSTIVIHNNAIIGCGVWVGGLALSGPAVTIRGLSSAKIANNIISHNTGGILRGNGSGVTLSHNDVWSNSGYDYTNLTPDAGSISQDPLFVSQTTYALSDTSPCRDAGDDAFVNWGDADYIGNDRIHGTHVDIGSTEWGSVPVMRLVFDAPLPRWGTVDTPLVDIGITVQDVRNHAVTTAVGSVTLSLRPVGGRADATLNGVLTRPVSGGHVVFPGVSFGKPALDYVLDASCDFGARGASSTPIHIGTVPHALVRVAPWGNDDNDGSVWVANDPSHPTRGPKVTVQGAVISTLAGGEVWVAAGTYAHTVVLPGSVSLYGGFAGGETERSARNSTLHVTVLDGQRSGSVLWVLAPEPSHATVDGFTIQNGLATYGGGVYCDGTSPTISNNRIIHNDAQSGAGVAGGSSSAVISHNLIAANQHVQPPDGIASAASVGGGVFGSMSSMWVQGNRIVGNRADLGGAVAFWLYTSAGRVRSNVIAGNGGWSTCDVNTSDASFVNNTMVANSGELISYIGWSGAPPAFGNNLCAFNQGTITGSGASFSHNLVFGNAGDDAANPLPAAYGNLILNPKLQNADYGQMGLLYNSPCLNAGDPTLVLPGETDVTGAPRKTGVVVAIGAYEGAGVASTPPVLHAATDGIDSADGASWGSARTLAGCLGSLVEQGADVLVKQGIYPSNLTLPPFAHVLGGYSGLGSAPDERNVTGYPTILDGGSTGPAVTAAAGYLVSGLDGLTLRNGTGAMRFGLRVGGNVYCDDAVPVLQHCTIANGVAHLGGGLWCGQGGVRVLDSTLSGNKGYLSGGAIRSDVGNLSAARSVFLDNVCYGDGGAVSGTGGDSLRNNLFAGNSAPTGSAISESVHTLIVNNTIAGNLSGPSVALTGGGSNSPRSLINNVIALNPGGIQDSVVPVMDHNDVFGNTIGGSAADYIGFADPHTNISVDPKFADAVARNFRPLPGSGGWEAGDNSAVVVGETDLDGRPRVVGLRADAGAYEGGPWTSAFTPTETRSALRIAAGIQAASGADLARMDVILTGTSMGRIRMEDANAILRRVAGLEANP